ncbi:uracil-DNA glycosylase superfamily protein [Paraglaciecola mesophila KMM 241]|uniref:Uracil-DNA glycosylase superfamily protein n=2 Tax=Paraglaciecola mesophila TaxID=197222 RepID=K6ZJI1_9ALTE|nr:uracil-DNA glycosylase superfamily protein [Paraglaciecola mesophila KMM 241]
MAFCYPGKASSGDKPPRKECAPLWHKRLISSMQIKHVLLIGQYAQNYYLQDKRSLTERVKDWQTYQPRFFVLPHPSPRNNIWLKKNPWFEQQVVLAMQHAIAKII